MAGWFRALALVVMQPSTDIFSGQSVFVTGHTGFKGGWLSLYLATLGARVHGFALDPPTSPSLFEVAHIGSVLSTDERGDLADRNHLTRAIDAVEPRFVFHLAAQPLVRASYRDPVGTFAANVMGTVHLLEAVRSVPGIKAVVIATTDKVYSNREWLYPYRENDRLGGHDPYSASKAAAEVAVASYRASFFANTGERMPRVATARAGNVIGGGDWASDRLVPDCLRSFMADLPVKLRCPQSIRPWQHVIEPVRGYVQLAALLAGTQGHDFAEAWNFGPGPGGDESVGDVAGRIARLWGGSARVESLARPNEPHEAGLLSLDTTAARKKLGWSPRWDLDSALRHTVDWQRAWLAGQDMHQATRQQIKDHQLANDT